MVATFSRRHVVYFRGMLSYVGENAPQIVPRMTLNEFHAGSLATRLLANLALEPENKAGILYVERKVLAMASKDPSIANIACNGIFNRWA